MVPLQNKERMKSVNVGVNALVKILSLKSRPVSYGMVKESRVPRANYRPSATELTNCLTQGSASTGIRTFTMRGTVILLPVL